MLVTASDYQPKAIFSPSGLSRAGRCLHAWGRRYLLGQKKPELTWEEAAALPVPKAKIKSKPTEAERKAKKAYNAKFRPALGKECHRRLEAYYRGGDIEWHDRVGSIILAGWEYLPHPDRCEVVEAEGEIEIEVDGVRFRGFRDLLVKQGGRWLLIDHKTTFTFDFFDREKTLRTVKTPEQLVADWQANLYAYAVMRREGLSELACRWVYYRTEDKPKGCAVDFVITWESASAVVAELVRLARQLTEYVGAALGGLVDVRALVESLEKNPEACPGFGGCEYHHEHDAGGDCVPPTLTPGERLVKLRAKQKARAALPPKPKTERKKTMGFRDKKTTTPPAPAPAAAAAEQPEAEATDEETQTDAEGEAEVAEAATDAQAPLEREPAAPSAPAPAPAASSAPKAPKPGPKPKAPKAVDGGVFIEAMGERVEIPSTFPAYQSLVRVVEAQAALNAALAGEP